MITSLSRRLSNRATAALHGLERGLQRIMIGWLLVGMSACAARIAASPLSFAPGPGTILPYVLLVLAPLGSMVLALRWFADGHRLAQPRTRLARLGRWRPLGREEAAAHPLYGPRGLMVSLLIGMLLNVPVRAAEFLAAMPALAGPLPPWLDQLRFALTLDVVLLTSLYSIAFVAALRRVPLFPRLLAAIWLIDLAMQLVIAEMIARTAGVPPEVAGALQPMLTGNLQKVLISVTLWLPYLLLSERVNVTYRHRTAR